MDYFLIDSVKMEEVFNRLDPDVRAFGKECIRALLAADVNSFQDLLAIVQHTGVNEKLRMAACWVLGQLGDRQATAALMKAFEHAGLSLTWEAAKSLGFLGDPVAVEPLVNYMLISGAVQKRAAAAYALGMLADNRALKPLLGVLINQQEDVIVREHATEALALLGNRGAVLPLIDSLRDDLAGVRFWSAYALGVLGDERALRDLKQLAATDHTVITGWGKISEEAANAIESIQYAASEE